MSRVKQLDRISKEECELRQVVDRTTTFINPPDKKSEAPTFSFSQTPKRNVKTNSSLFLFAETQEQQRQRRGLEFRRGQAAPARQGASASGKHQKAYR